MNHRSECYQEGALVVITSILNTGKGKNSVGNRSNGLELGREKAKLVPKTRDLVNGCNKMLILSRRRGSILQTAEQRGKRGEVAEDARLSGVSVEMKKKMGHIPDIMS